MWHAVLVEDARHVETVSTGDRVFSKNAELVESRTAFDVERGAQTEGASDTQSPFIGSTLVCWVKRDCRVRSQVDV